MPLVESSFRPPCWLRNAHLQTVLPVVFPRRFDVAYQRERLELSDGDFLDLDWARGGFSRLVILSHGLEGDSCAGYIRGMDAALNAAGWDALAWTYRGCGTEPNRLLRFYHSGETGDLGRVIDRAATVYPIIGLVGFSLGGNLTLKYLGEKPPHASVARAVAISAPIDLASSAGKLDSDWQNRIYLKRFIKTLIAKVEAKALRFPDHLDVSEIQAIRTFQQFDDRYTSRIHGFRDAADYWAQSSALPLLGGIGVPSLLINARDDPFLSPLCFPEWEAHASASFFLEAPAHGGHVGFLETARRNGATWLERRVIEFLGQG